MVPRVWLNETFQVHLLQRPHLMVNIFLVIISNVASGSLFDML